MGTYKRKPNTSCVKCGTPIYRRPNEIVRFGVSYCSSKCMWDVRGRIPSAQCKNCGESFQPSHKDRDRKFCGRTCANKGRKGIKYPKDAHGNLSRKRLAQLQQKFGQLACMLEGCGYDKVLEVHRHLPGSRGGEYKIGNMFSICPNHHAEITRGLLKVKKVSDHRLIAA